MYVKIGGQLGAVITVLSLIQTKPTQCGGLAMPSERQTAASLQPKSTFVVAENPMLPIHAKQLIGLRTVPSSVHIPPTLSSGKRRFPFLRHPQLLVAAVGFWKKLTCSVPTFALFPEL